MRGVGGREWVMGGPDATYRTNEWQGGEGEFGVSRAPQA